MPTYRKKTEKLINQIDVVSRAAVKYWSAYKKILDADVSLGGCPAAKASFGYATDLIGSASQTKIAYNQMK